MGQEEDEFEIKIIAGLKLISKSMPNIAIILYKKEFWQQRDNGGEGRVDTLSFLSRASVPKVTICDLQTF